LILKIKKSKKYYLNIFSSKNILKKNTVNYNIKLHNILKGLSAPLTIYLDSEHCGLEYFNGSLALAIKSCKGIEGGGGAIFFMGCI
jgi:hypothetical protein